MEQRERGGLRTLEWQQRVTIGAAVAVVLLVATPRAEANLVRGVQEVVAGVLEVPLSTLAGTFSGPPVFGTAVGAVGGVVRGVGLVAQGALDLVSGAVPLAKAAVPYLLPFLL